MQHRQPITQHAWAHPLLVISWKFVLVLNPINFSNVSQASLIAPSNTLEPANQDFEDCYKHPGRCFGAGWRTVALQDQSLPHVLWSILLKKIVKKVWARTQPCFTLLSIAVSHLSGLVVMQLDDHVKEQLFYELLNTFSAHSIKCVGKVKVHETAWWIELFFFLEIYLKSTYVKAWTHQADDRSVRLVLLV